MERWLGISNNAERVVEIWIDGSCEPINPGGTACGAYIIRCQGSKAIKCFFIVGKGKGMTSNVAEYNALIHALKKLYKLALQRDFIKIKSDSELLVKQINRLYAVKAPLLIPLYQSAKELLKGIRYQIEWIPREKNKETDRLTHIAYEKSLKKKN
jgi:ribonuclease HI